MVVRKLLASITGGVESFGVNHSNKSISKTVSDPTINAIMTISNDIKDFGFFIKSPQQLL
jgi:hypothetical protein